MKMLRHTLLIPLIWIAFLSTAFSQIPFQARKGTYRISYRASNNGQPAMRGNKILLFTNSAQTLLTNERDFEGRGEFPLEITMVSGKPLLQHLYTFLNDSLTLVTTDTAAIKNQKFEWTDETKTILGYACKKAKTIVNSNTIELWYTRALPVKGAPTALGQDIGLVLEMVRNGNYTLTGAEVQQVDFVPPVYFTKARPKSLDLLSYKDAIWRSRFTTIPLFTQQRINFSDTATFAPDVLRFANGTIVVKKIKFPSLKGVGSIFLDLKEQSGGDAYDRTGSVFLIPAVKKQTFLDGLRKGVAALPVYENGNGKKYQGVVTTAAYDPAIELMRFFTPFGIQQYNHIQLKGKQWHQSVPYRQDISAFSALLDDQEVYIGVFIGNYDKGGHSIDAAITLHRDEQQPVAEQVIPVFNTLNLMEMAGQEYATMFDAAQGLVADFELRKPVKNAVLRYTTTGHGGWENGDEFVPKKNTVLLDGKAVFQLVPWREDCGSYRLFNPASGNFNNGLSSSDLSRSNWCPGTVTNPFMIPLGDLSAGRHRIQVKIPQGAREGSSFSAWNVSGVILGN